MAEMRTSPVLRFAGFTDTWEQRKLKNITTKIGSGQTPHGGEKVYKQSGVMFLRSQNINNNQVNLEDVRYIDENTNNKMANSAVNQGDILLNITGASIGRSAVYNYSMNANVNQHVCIIRLKNKSLAKFLQILLSSEKGQNQIRINQAGGGREGLNFQQISAFKFLFPSKLEISNITKLMLRLEDTIAHHQRKLDLLKKLKQALLQKMFPKNGQNTPEIRFAGFNNAWGNKSLSEVGNFLRTSVNPQDTPDSTFMEYSMPAYDNDHAPKKVLGASMKSTRLKISNNVLLINKLNVRQRRVWLVIDASENAVASSEFLPFVSEDIDMEFLEQFMKLSKTTHDLESLSSGTSNSQKRVTPTDVLKYKIDVPEERDEQEKIGVILQRIDEAHVLYQSQITKLKQLKRSLLQKLFM